MEKKNITTIFWATLGTLATGVIIAYFSHVMEYSWFVSNEPQSSALIETSINQSTKDKPLAIFCRMDKGDKNLIYRAGEIMRLYINANQSCQLRIIYKLADGRLVLFEDNLQVKESDTGRFVEIGNGYEVSPPFGKEAIYIFAQKDAFQELATHQDTDGYLFITEGLPETLERTRGFKKIGVFEEAFLNITTSAN